MGPVTLNLANAGNDNWISADLEAMGGDIDSVTGIVTGGAGGLIALQLSASSQNDLGGTIGDISITNASNYGKTYMAVSADASVGAITVNHTGTDESEVGVALFGGTSATTVGDITVNYGANHTGYAGGLMMELDTSGATVGNVTVTGGSTNSMFYIAKDAEYSSMLGMWGEKNTAYQVGTVDLSAFRGWSMIDLSGVEMGTTIKSSIGGSNIYGTEGEDTITLGAGRDAVLFDLTPTSVDTIDDFAVGAGGDMLGVGVFDDGVLIGSVNGADKLSYASVLNGTVFNSTDGSTVADSVDQNEVIRLVTDIGEADGLATALATDGSLAGLVAADGTTSATLVTANSGSVRALNLYRIEDSDGDTVFDMVTLIGVVNASSDNAIASLRQDNFA